MPFGVRTMAQQRQSLVDEFRSGGHTISGLCLKYGISRPTAYRWLSRSNLGGSMENCSRAPQRIHHKTPEGVEKAIINLRGERPAWGSRR
jgi:transposase-like protein